MMPNEQEDMRLHALLNIIPSLSRKDVKSVKITFVSLIDVMRAGQQDTLVVPQLEVVYKESKE